MSRKAGALLWNRLRIPSIPAAINAGPPGILDVDTGLCQVNKPFPSMSPNEPSFTNPSRVQIVPMSPIASWNNITHGEPFLDPATNTIHVVFTNSGFQPVTNLNVLCWDPHSIAGPGDADTYNP